MKNNWQKACVIQKKAVPLQCQTKRNNTTMTRANKILTIIFTIVLLGMVFADFNEYENVLLLVASSMIYLGLYLVFEEK